MAAHMYAMYRRVRSPMPRSPVNADGNRTHTQDDGRRLASRFSSEVSSITAASNRPASLRWAVMPRTVSTGCLIRLTDYGVRVRRWTVNGNRPVSPGVTMSGGPKMVACPSSHAALTQVAGADRLAFAAKLGTLLASILVPPARLVIEIHRAGASAARRG